MKAKISWWGKFQLWLMRKLPTSRDHVTDLEQTIASLQRTVDTFNDMEARHSKRIAAQEKKHKQQIKNLRKELVQLIDGSHPSPDSTWLEMGMKRAILRDTFGAAGPGTIYTAQRMADRVIKGEMELSYLQDDERKQVADLLCCEFGKHMLDEMAAKFLIECVDRLNVEAIKNYSSNNMSFVAYLREQPRVSLSIAKSMFDDMKYVR